MLFLTNRPSINPVTHILTQHNTPPPSPHGAQTTPPEQSVSVSPGPFLSITSGSLLFAFLYLIHTLLKDHTCRVLRVVLVPLKGPYLASMTLRLLGRTRRLLVLVEMTRRKTA